MPRIKQSSIEAVRARVPIEQVVGEYVALKRSGSVLKGLSPFSHEKTPSFTVSPDKGLFYCFSTSQGGDMFDFVMKLENLNFAESVEFVAKKFGIELEYDYSGAEVNNASLHKQLFEMHEDAATWFADQFFADNEQAAAIRKYWVEERKMTLDDAKRLRIGYAPVNSTELKRLFAKKRYTPEAVVKSSIFSAREGERNFANFYPKFRGRLMIPICDIQGRVIAFTGRKTQFTPDNPSESGKYVNSHETEIFKKGNVVFNIHQAKNFIKQKDYCVLVEGQLDALRMFTAGIPNTVATQGTALTDNHLSQIKRFCNRVVLLYDGDAAGVRANLKAISMCLKHELEPFVVPLPEGEDPDSFIGKFGAEKMRELVENKKIGAITFAAKTLTAAAGEITAQKKGEIVSDIFAMIFNCKSSIVANEYLRETAANLGVSYVSLADDYDKFAKQSLKAAQKQPADSAAADDGAPAPAKAEYKISTAPADALILALLRPEIGAAMAQVVQPEWLDQKKLSGRILTRLLAMYREGIEFEPSKIEEFFETSAEKNAIYKILANPKILIENPVKSANDCIKRIYKNHISVELEKVNAKITDPKIDEPSKLQLLKTVAELTKKSRMFPDLIEEI